MQILMLLMLFSIAVMVTSIYRKSRDREEIVRRLQEKGGRLVRLRRARKGHPFSDTGRGWWAWRVEWADGAGEHIAWALTTREGIKDWRE